MPEIVYYYRGQIEVPTTKRRRLTYRWAGGWSEQGAHGPCYPWKTKTQCRVEAEARGATARFVRQGSDADGGS